MTLNQKVFNTEKTDYEHASLFLGEDNGLLDSVNKQYPVIWSLYKLQKAQDWDESEFDFSSCARDFQTCSKSTYDMMIKTLAWQWEADSIAARNIAPVVAPFITSSELWAAWLRVSDNECVIDGTEVLTPNGWVDLKNVSTDTLVAQFDPNNDVVSFVNPSRVIEKQYDGTMYRFHNHQLHFEQNVTENHRMIKFDGDEYVVKEAHDMNFNHGYGVVSGHAVNTVTELSDLHKFFIAVQADGSISSRYDGSLVGTVPVWFEFSKQRKIDRLLKICEKLSFNIRELSGVPEVGNVKAKFRFEVDVPVIYTSYLKNFDWVELSDKSSEWCKEFLTEITHWDGHYTKNAGILHTTSKQAVDVSQAVAHMCGMKTHLRRIQDNRKEAYNDCWRLSWKDTRFVSGQKINKTKFDYSGLVRCVTVPTGFFLTRYKNSASITGNCIHALTYSEIVRNSFENPSEVIAEILAVKESFARLEDISKVFADGYVMSHKLALGQVDKTSQEVYNAIFMLVIALWCLERIKFVASFAVTFSICETGLFAPIGKAVMKIAADEFDVHCELDRAIMDVELQTERGKIAFTQNRELIKSLIDEVVESEKAWTEYLFSEERELVGVDKDSLFQWVLYCAKELYQYFGIKSEYELPEKNPLKFMDSWLNLSKIQASPQEEKIGAYFLGAVVDTAGSKEYDLDF